MSAADELPGPETTGAWAREIADIVGARRLASLMGVRPQTVYTWLSSTRSPAYDTYRRLRILHECVATIRAGADDPHAVIVWLSAPSKALRSTPAQTILTYYPSNYVDQDLLKEAGVYVRDLNAPPPVDTSRQAARLFIGLVSSSVTAGVLGDRRDDRVYVRPAEAVEHARRVAEARREAPFDFTVNRVGRGLSQLGAATSGGKNSVIRRINGQTIRVWDLPASLFG